MNITFLGTCANQTIDREGVAFLLECDGARVLVDAGPGVVRQLYKTGHKPAEVTHIILTHCHGDHTSGFAYLLWSRFYDSLDGTLCTSPLVVYGLSSVLAAVKHTVDAFYPGARWPFETVYTDVKGTTNKVALTRDLTVRFVDVDHSVPCLGMKFDSPNASLAYSADTLYSSAFVSLAEDCDLMIHEGFVDVSMSALSAKTKHATAHDAGRAARDARAGSLALVHTFPPLVGKEHILVNEASAVFGGHVCVPAELSNVALP